MNWELLVPQYLAQYPDTHFRVREILEDLVRGGRKVLSRAIDLEIAEASKPESTRFLLYLTAHALQDHTLTDAEVSDLRTLRRVFRIHEGDLRKYHPETVTSLLCRQAELIFEDQAISREEAIYKARLQEAFGLGYDEFMGILEPELNRLVRDLYEALDSNGLADWLGADWRRASDRLAALSLVRYVEGLAKGRSSRAGYIYLLVNSSMPGIVKIGHTGQPPRRRAEELASATGVPTPFTLVFDLFVPDASAAEAYVHRVLTERGARVSDNREFFAIEPSDAVRVMLEASSTFDGPIRLDPPGSESAF